MFLTCACSRKNLVAVVLFWALLMVCRARVGDISEGGFPILSEFGIVGILPSNAHRPIPFIPTFEATSANDNYHCYLDYNIGVFSLTVESQGPAVLSKITRNGLSVQSRFNLTNIRLRPGEKTIFSVSVTFVDTKTYTLIVERRTGHSTELMDMIPITANLTRPFHPGELQEHFAVTQAFYEDLFEFEYIKADGGQKVDCLVDKHGVDARTIGGDAPTPEQVYRHPKFYYPGLEKMTPKTVDERYDPIRGNVVTCRVPIDTWREIVVTLQITSSDKTHHRRVRLVVTRKGCPRGNYYYKGLCTEFCPTYFYKQRFNWRCGACNTNCEFCTSWHRCTTCKRDSSLERYRRENDGTCTALRVHPYRMYYDLARYLTICCAVLMILYCIICTVWAGQKAIYGDETEVRDTQFVSTLQPSRGRGSSSSSKPGGSRGNGDRRYKQGGYSDDVALE